MRSQQQRFPTRIRYWISHNVKRRPDSWYWRWSVRKQAQICHDFTDFILTSAAATLPMLLMSISMVRCPLKYGNLHRISTTQRAVQFCD